MKLLDTDFYQLSIVLAYIISNKANDIAGFECFYRHPKQELENVCYFKGEKEIHSFMSGIKKEIESKSFVNDFVRLITPKIRIEKREEYIRLVREFFQQDFSFEYSVYKDDCVVPPLTPVFQIRCPRWIGTLLETPITNIINGRTGLNTQRHLGKMSEYQRVVVEGDRTSPFWNDYLNKVRDKAIAYRLSTEKPIMDASYRRAGGLKISVKVAEIAMEMGFNGTSNVAARVRSPFIKDEMIGGTMAHSFVMSYNTELEAFKVWNEVFPHTSFLVDTYDTVKTVKKLVREDLKPENVRIDSGDFYTICKEVRDIFDEAGWYDVGIYISGDLTPELLFDLEDNKVPFDKCMVGTKLANLGEIVAINPGFVYKLVEYTSNGKRVFPVKKACGKGNYPGLKRVVCSDKVLLKDGFGFEGLDLIKEDMEVVYDF